MQEAVARQSIVTLDVEGVLIPEIWIAAAERSGIDELRRIAHDLHPDRLERLGLREACQRVVETTLDRAGLEYEHELDDVDARLEDAQALHVYRILQEALTNLVRHAQAERAKVTLGIEEGDLVLRVEDDGVGVGHKRDGLGLSSMWERARAARGRLKISAPAGGGTVVEARLPEAQ